MKHSDNSGFTTDNEILFIRGMGRHRPHSQDTFSKIIQGYAEAFSKRVEWGDIDKDAVWKEVQRQLK